MRTWLSAWPAALTASLELDAAAAPARLLCCLLGCQLCRAPGQAAARRQQPARRALGAAGRQCSRPHAVTRHRPRPACRLPQCRRPAVPRAPVAQPPPQTLGLAAQTLCSRPVLPVLFFRLIRADLVAPILWADSIIRPKSRARTLVAIGLDPPLGGSKIIFFSPNAASQTYLM